MYPGSYNMFVAPYSSCGLGHKNFLYVLAFDPGHSAVIHCYSLISRLLRQVQGHLDAIHLANYFFQQHQGSVTKLNLKTTEGHS